MRARQPWLTWFSPLTFENLSSVARPTLVEVMLYLHRFSNLSRRLPHAFLRERVLGGIGASRYASLRIYPDGTRRAGPLSGRG